MYRRVTSLDKASVEFETLNCDGHSYWVPKIIHDDSNATIKNQFYLRTVEAVCHGPGPHLVKMGALAKRFSVGPSTLTVVKAAFDKLLDHQSQTIALTNDEVFALDDFKLFSQRGTPIVFRSRDKRLSRMDKEEGLFSSYRLRVYPNQAHAECTTRRL